MVSVQVGHSAVDASLNLAHVNLSPTVCQTVCYSLGTQRQARPTGSLPSWSLLSSPEDRHRALNAGDSRDYTDVLTFVLQPPPPPAQGLAHSRRPVNAGRKGKRQRR